MIYVVLGICGKHEEKDMDVLYVGQDENKAMSYGEKLEYHTLYLETWVKEKQVKIVSKESSNKWKVEYDLLRSIDRDLSDKQREMEKIQSEYEELMLLKTMLQGK